MRCAVFANDARPIHSEGHRYIHQTRIVHHLVVSALQEGRVDRDDGPCARFGESGGHRHRVLFGDARVVEARREAIGEGVEPRARRHRRRDRVDAQVAFRELDQRRREGLGEGGPLLRFRGLGRQLAVFPTGAADFIDGRGGRGFHAVHAFGMLVRAGVALALLRQHVQQHDTVESRDAFDLRLEPAHVVPVDRADVGHAEFFEDVTRNDRVTHHFADLLERPIDARPDHRDRVDQVLGLLTSPLDQTVGANAREVARERTDRLRDRPLVVVEHDQQLGARLGMEIGLDAVTFRCRAVDFPAAAIFFHKAHFPTLVGQQLCERSFAQPFRFRHALAGVATSGCCACDQSQQNACSENQ